MVTVQANLRNIDCQITATRMPIPQEGIAHGKMIVGFSKLAVTDRMVNTEHVGLQAPVTLIATLMTIVQAVNALMESACTRQWLQLQPSQIKVEPITSTRM
jgi:hypothetical protein